MQKKKKKQVAKRKVRVASRQKLPSITLTPITAHDIRRIVAKLEES